MNKIDLMNHDNPRWKADFPEMPPKAGKIDDVNKFDAGYFGKSNYNKKV